MHIWRWSELIFVLVFVPAIPKRGRKEVISLVSHIDGCDIGGSMEVSAGDETYTSSAE